MKWGTNLKYQIHKLKFSKISFVLGKLWGRAECCFVIWKNDRAWIGIIGSTGTNVRSTGTNVGSRGILTVRLRIGFFILAKEF